MSSPASSDLASAFMDLQREHPSPQSEGMESVPGHSLFVLRRQGHSALMLVDIAALTFTQPMRELRRIRADSKLAPFAVSPPSLDFSEVSFSTEICGPSRLAPPKLRSATAKRSGHSTQDALPRCSF